MLFRLFLHANRLVRYATDKLVGTSYTPTRDVVVITGGASGLGEQLAQRFASHKATVISLDIHIPPPENRIDGVVYYECDVSNTDQVWEAQNSIQSKYGSASILINNAGITAGKKLVDLTCHEVETILNVNLLASFYTVKAFLPAMLERNRGYIVTVGSVLGYMSPARLSVYGASKAGLVALHESLTYELGSPMFHRGVKTLLVCPGQMKTPMFKSVATPSRLFAPELDVGYVADRIVAAVSLGQQGEIRLPLYGKFIPIFRAFPWPLVELVRKVSGIDRSMQAFRSGASSLRGAATSLLASSGSVLGPVSAVLEPGSASFGPVSEILDHSTAPPLDQPEGALA
ncbi:hypothetical protein PSN45_000177 [Yamadazyma tenuis]|uniref:NAD(P)-binding protein n=1 Tax=Candida tenuis (strain ATCC 10573 / BCRC 21748 / CBS 615 / JCM 9827 / NBRC 10315 / NRRL Y-1498 / VKM Y-70) TaxID=590646 RepID=G3BB73_CANTC|nr:NAD(P)-binding protein [Yamadazyma tenuis ATCC 10573]XP_006687673.1 uncharacterized protein CANTEDRAFT_124259 [Yamadazyma tenuis ATCC 10573]EGV61502.1 NAD(P)-binding protein [Yamadazyma tenuis ATCC 10573]EGV61503.1 hypothetical protein CANTEDRAFT_124259 [Yamadazyma tenuis ATCC 10573]WEJ92722.1 hypothetical protein PSN45_000177 [Yamadazyma tenuis]